MPGAEFEPGAKLLRWEQNLSRPEAALKQVGALMVAETQQAFRDQKFGDRAWPARKVPNVAAIIKDFHEGKKAPPKRRFDPRPALIDTGGMRAKAAFRLISVNVVEAGINDPKASKHHAGGESETLPITETVRTGLASWLKGAGKAWRTKLGWLLNAKFAGKTLKLRLPARPMVGITKQTIEDVQEAVGVRIMEVR